MSKATPGPWKAIITQHITSITDAKDNRISWDGLHDHQIANARLIAAAPELLDALKVAVTRLKEWKLKTGDIEELIAKVEGTKD